jgi:hypothetical protein
MKPYLNPLQWLDQGSAHRCQFVGRPRRICDISFCRSLLTSVGLALALLSLSSGSAKHLNDGNVTRGARSHRRRLNKLTIAVDKRGSIWPISFITRIWTMPSPH